MLRDKKKKVLMTYFFILLFDVILVIFCANKNKVNYAKFFDEDILMGKNHVLIWGRNYINAVITLFFYLYVLLMNRFFLHVKNSWFRIVIIFLFLLILNIILFFIFTKKVY